MGLMYVFEISFVVFLILGIILALSIQSAVLNAIIIMFIFGVLAATESQFRKTDLNFPYVLLIIGFLLGYVIASKGSKFLLIIVFLMGITLGVFIKNFLKGRGDLEEEKPRLRRQIRNI